ncbi:MAG: hypothetical protein IT288_03220 [Bdellovibrionales bacterium]|nr:hypothetical protein [Bdellovibrionales bacterium]
MKTLVVGGTQDFGLGLTQFLGEKAFGIGRTNGYDLTKSEVIDRVVAMSKEYEVVVVVANAKNRQPEVVEKIALEWIASDHPGYLICLGTSAVYHDKYDREPSVWSYLRMKQGLSLLTKYIGWQVTNENVKMRFTNIQVGRLDNQAARSRGPFKTGIKSEEVGRIIRFLIDTPRHLCIHELVIDPKY